MSGNHSSADRNLLVAILALHNDFLSKQQLLDAIDSWAGATHTPLADVLERRGDLEPQCRSLLDAIVDERLKRCGGNVDAGLASVAGLSSTVDAIDVFSNVEDDRLRTLAHSLVPELRGRRVHVHCFSGDARGRFDIVCRHAAGGLGEVFVAKDNELNREVALKQIREQFCEDERLQARFKLEAEITGGLEHPGIVPIYSLGVDSAGRPFYAMRFIRGDSLKQAIDRFHRVSTAGESGPEPRADGAAKPDFDSLEFRGLLRRFIDVCNAVAFAHSRGILHRDIKPGNIMLGGFGETLVVDWGLAKALGRPSMHPAQIPVDTLTSAAFASAESDATEPGSTVGTPAYMSPEQAGRSNGEIGPAADIYSLGATLYTLLTGKPAFAGASPVEIIEKVRVGDFPPARSLQPAIPKALEAVCEKAMALEPTERYGTALDLAAEIERWLGDEPLVAYREPIVRRVRRWVRKRAALVAGFTAALAVGLVAAAIGIAVVGNKNRELRVARDAAEAEFRRAKKAIDEYFIAVSESPELREKFPGMHELRMGLLEKAQAYYQDFLDQRGQDRSLQSDAAAAFFNRAYVAAETGRLTDAIDGYNRSLAIWQALASENPDVEDYSVRLAQAHNNLGNAQHQAGEYKSASENHAAALRLLERLAAGRPENRGHAAELAATLNNLAEAQAGSGDSKAALANHSRAVALRQKLADENPSVIRYARDLASSLNNLGNVQYTTGDAEAALASHGRALAIRRKIADAPSALAVDIRHLGISHNNMVALRSTAGDADAAMFHCRKATEIFERLAVQNPAVAEYAVESARANFNMGILQSAGGNLQDALSSHQKALAIREKLAGEKTAGAALLSELAQSHNNIGLIQQRLADKEAARASFNRAISVQERLVRDYPKVADFAIHLAGAHCNFGNFIRDIGEPADSLSHYDRAFALLGPHADKNIVAKQFLCYSRWGRGRACLKLDRFDEALVECDAALKLADAQSRTLIQADRDAAARNAAARKTP